MAVNLAEPSSPVIADRDSEETKSGKDVEETVQVVSLLERLKAPKKSDLSRKRKIACNPPKGKKKSSGKHGLAEPKVDPRTRVKEFPNEALVVSPGNRRLFFNACRETLSVKRSTVADHIKSSKHKASKKKLRSKEAKQQDIAIALTKYDQSVHPVGENLTSEQRVYRIKVATAFLRAGIPLAKLVHFRDILEENALRLTDSSHMLDLIPFILEQEKSKIKDEIKGKFISIIFDGTSRLGEVLAVVIRYVDQDWKVVQRLIRLEFLVKSMTGEEVARELINLLSMEYCVKSPLLLAAMRDGASVNSVAMRTVSVVYPSVLDVRCFSHTLDIVGTKFNTPTLTTFISLWISLFSHSPKTKALWKDQTGKSMASFSKTRCWSRWEVMQQVMVQFGDLLPFLDRNQDIGPALREKLLEILKNNQRVSLLKIELAAIVDVGEHFVKSTYNLEGDGPQ